MNLRDMTNICCRLSLIFIALFALVACDDTGGGDTDGGGTDGGGTDGTVGATLYQANCSSCHDAFASSTKAGASANQIQNAINNDAGGMGVLSSLTPTQVQAIADALSGSTGGGGGGSAALNIIAVHNPNSPQYNDNCLNCHSDIPTAQSLSPAIPNAHVAMLAFTPGENSDQCVWCHRDVSNTLIHTTAQVGAFQTNIRKTVDSQLCGICHGPVGPGKPFYQSGLTTSADPDGSQLYSYLCSSCHKELSNSEVKGESTQEIYKAIGDNEGGMAPLNVLSPQWVQAITVALGGDPTLPPSIPAPGTGSSLYQQYCSSCHGALASSTKADTSAALIQNGINTITQMTSLSFLTSTQVQAIADALGGVTGGGGTGGTDGASLYQTNCSSCHGALASSDKAGASASQTQNAINNDTGGMGVLSSLTLTQIQAISGALSGGTGGGGGSSGPPASHTDSQEGALHAPGKDTPYSSSCTACHGTTLQGDIGPSCFSCHDQKWNENPPGGGGGGGTDGESLYNQYCSSCHRSLSRSEVRGKDEGDIEDAIDDNEGDMGSLGFLSEDQIEAIADALDGDS